MKNGRAYVGSHCKPVFNKNYWGGGDNIKKAIKIYGRDNFKRKVLYWADTYEELLLKETHYITMLFDKIGAQAYNIARDAVAAMRGRKHSESTKLLYSQTRMGENNSMFGVSMSGAKNGMYGKNHTEKTKKIISEKLSLNRGEDHGNYGKVRSKYTINKISSSKKGKITPQSPDDTFNVIHSEKRMFYIDCPSYIQNIISSYRAGVWQKQKTVISNINRVCEYFDCHQFYDTLLEMYAPNKDYYKNTVGCQT
ncbi:hypothetical protein E0F88_07450 [Dyadobacter psychrotolerans]|uniref:Nuclease associated modular domain-containing protein n=2 Tax=Dyadobacter psychrotolerans TaxID=2541721 RepID=A0A4R5DV65_9BACT|nr:hypothetical protein E0F88_07450 [Dyadobacter psychrotolerans]